MKVDLNNLNPGTWFDFPDGGRVCLRLLSTGKAQEIDKIVRKVKYVYKDAKQFEEVEYNDALHDEMMWDYCIVNWEGIVGADDQPIPCTKDNKLKLMFESAEFIRFINASVEKLATVTQKKREADSKN